MYKIKINLQFILFLIYSTEYSDQINRIEKSINKVIVNCTAMSQNFKDSCQTRNDYFSLSIKKKEEEIKLMKESHTLLLKSIEENCNSQMNSIKQILSLLQSVQSTLLNQISKKSIEKRSDYEY